MADTSTTAPAPEPTPQNWWVWTHPGQIERLVSVTAADAAKEYADSHGITCGKRVYVAADTQVEIQGFDVDLQVGK